MRLRFAGLIFAGLAASSAYAQYVISAHSGVIQVVEGSAYLNDKAVETKFGQFPDIKNGQEFRTEQGRAEVLLTPGVFLRMGENSSIKMVSNLLTDTRVEVLSGSAIVECDEIPKDNSIELLYKNSTMMLTKHGLYRVNSDPAQFKVYDGEATVKGESGQLTLKAGKETSLSGVLMAENFDKKDSDDLSSWSSRRAGYLSTANASSAMAIHNSGGYGGGYSGAYTGGCSGYSTGFLGTGFLGTGLSGCGGWQFNPMFGMFTYMPMSGFGYSPYGLGWWSPSTIGYYTPTSGYFGGGGITTASKASPVGAAASGRVNASAPFSSGGFASRGGGTASGGGGGMSAGGGGGHAGGAGHK
jgi:hypothetical protein